jgi:signal transduction histidine kinase
MSNSESAMPNATSEDLFTSAQKRPVVLCIQSGTGVSTEAHAAYPPPASAGTSTFSTELDPSTDAGTSGADRGDETMNILLSEPLPTDLGAARRAVGVTTDSRRDTDDFAARNAFFVRFFQGGSAFSSSNKYPIGPCMEQPYVVTRSAQKEKTGGTTTDMHTAIELDPSNSVLPTFGGIHSELPSSVRPTYFDPLAATAHRLLDRLLMALGAMQPIFGAISLFDSHGNLELAASRTRHREVAAAIGAMRLHDHPSVLAAATGTPIWCGWPRIRTEMGALASAPVDAGAWAAVPLDAAGRVIGVLSACFGEPLGFDVRDRATVLAIAQVATSALTDSGEEARSIGHTDHALLRERERLAGDLHDGVVQQVIATSMTLAAMSGAAPRDLRPQIEYLINRQDEIVRELRATIFSLQSHQPWSTSATVELVNIVEQATASLGFRPELHLHGVIDRIDTVAQLGHLLYALREMLSNVARHANATKVVVSVSIDDHQVSVVVEDNGVGVAHVASAGNGIPNLNTRARMLGGSCRIRPSASGGTAVEWTVPVLA